MLRDRTSRRFLYISILLNLLFILVPTVWEEAVLRALVPTPSAEEPVEQRLAFRFVETPDIPPDQPPETETELISDKDLRASNPVAPAELPVGQAYAEGILEFPSMETPAGETVSSESGQRTTGPTPRARADDGPRESGAGEVPRAEERLAFPEVDERVRSSPPSGGAPPQLPADQRQWRAEDQFEIGLSTYAWEWAPYLSMLKRRIESNWYPPAAFWLGIAQGQTALRFRILPDGRVVQFQTLSELGHQSLHLASRNAIRSSIPLPALPPDFPEDFLDITVQFRYILLPRG